MSDDVRIVYVVDGVEYPDISDEMAVIQVA